MFLILVWLADLFAGPAVLVAARACFPQHLRSREGCNLNKVQGSGAPGSSWVQLKVRVCVCVCRQ